MVTEGAVVVAREECADATECRTEGAAPEVAVCEPMEELTDRMLSRGLFVVERSARRLEIVNCRAKAGEVDVEGSCGGNRFDPMLSGSQLACGEVSIRKKTHLLRYFSSSSAW